MYLARLLKHEHDVTVFESGAWGGDIRTEHIGGKCYPISALFAMPGDALLKGEVRRLKIRTRPLHSPPIVYLIAILLVIAALSALKRRVAVITFTLCISVVGALVADSELCKVVLAFGGDKDCKSLHKFYTYGGGLRDVLFNSILYLEDCGPSAIVDSYLNDEDVTYIKEKVVRISRNDGCTFTLGDNRRMDFDKCIITTRYDNYKDIVSLSGDEIGILSGTEYFDFYSTLIVASSTFDVAKVANSIGSFQLDDGVHLFASHRRIEVEPGTYTLKRAYKWRMPRVYDAAKKQTINNDATRNVFFAGKEVSGNGMNHCMKYSLKLKRTFTKDFYKKTFV